MGGYALDTDPPPHNSLKVAEGPRCWLCETFAKTLCLKFTTQVVEDFLLRVLLENLTTNDLQILQTKIRKDSLDTGLGLLTELDATRRSAGY